MKFNKKKNGHTPPLIDWDNVELQVYSLKAPGPPEQKLKKAKALAAIYQQHGKPLPDALAILV